MRKLLIFLTIFTIAIFMFLSCEKNSTESSANVPEVVTAEVSAITGTSAQCGGTITSDGEAAVTSRGVCWSTGQTPTISDNKTDDGTGEGSFTSNITGLTAETTYYVRAYATNSSGTGYGSAMSFATFGIPELITADISEIIGTTAQCGGTITSDGGTTVTARGVCWSTGQNPTVEDDTTNDGTGAGSFTSYITGLTVSTTYYVRAYATNSAGTGYGSAMSFTTEEALTDIDGNTYQTVKIGNQWWMAENLKVTHYRNGHAIPNVTGDTEWSNLTTGAYCNYDNDDNNADTYGSLYNWYAVNDRRNIAPYGWHVPRDADWKTLEMYLGMSQSEADDTGYRGTDEGGKMKETGTTHWDSPNTGATNESGFSALPGGYLTNNGNYISMGRRAKFWSSTDYNSYTAWYRYLNCHHSEVDRGYDAKQYGLSVRCVRY